MSTERPLQDSDDATINDTQKRDFGKLENGGDFDLDKSKEEGLGSNGVIGPGKPERTMVTLEPEDDPKQLPLARKWLAVLTISSAALCVTCTSSIVSEFVSWTVCNMGRCLYHVGGGGGGRRSTRFPCFKGGCDLGYKLIRRRPRMWASPAWAFVGVLWTKPCISCFLHHLLDIFLAGRLCAEYW